MSENQTRDLLIRNVPIEIHELLQQEAKDHHRSKTQEAIIALTNGLTLSRHRIKRPTPFKWKSQISNKFIKDAIDEGRK